VEVTPKSIRLPKMALEAREPAKKLEGLRDK
jgi:hypothetical protein